MKKLSVLLASILLMFTVALQPAAQAAPANPVTASELASGTMVGPDAGPIVWCSISVKKVPYLRDTPANVFGDSLGSCDDGVDTWEQVTWLEYNYGVGWKTRGYTGRYSGGGSAGPKTHVGQGFAFCDKVGTLVQWRVKSQFTSTKAGYTPFVSPVVTSPVKWLYCM